MQAHAKVPEQASAFPKVPGQLKQEPQFEILQSSTDTNQVHETVDVRPKSRSTPPAPMLCIQSLLHKPRTTNDPTDSKGSEIKIDDSTAGLYLDHSQLALPHAQSLLQPPGMRAGAAAASATQLSSAQSAQPHSVQLCSDSQPWSSVEDRMLEMALGDLHYVRKAKLWAEVGLRVQSRNTKQCRERWLTKLKPKIRKPTGVSMSFESRWSYLCRWK
eukprot:SAG31_NODE_301_length_18103_cov_13.772551_9_plen_216_part_00